MSGWQDQTQVLWVQEYVQEIGSCLLQLGSPATTAPTLQLVTSAMQRLTVEAADLCAILLQDPVANKALITARLDEGAEAINALDTEFYTGLLVRTHISCDTCTAFAASACSMYLMAVCHTLNLASLHGQAK